MFLVKLKCTGNNLSNRGAEFNTKALMFNAIGHIHMLDPIFNPNKIININDSNVLPTKTCLWIKVNSFIYHEYSIMRSERSNKAEFTYHLKKPIISINHQWSIFLCIIMRLIKMILFLFFRLRAWIIFRFPDPAISHDTLTLFICFSIIFCSHKQILFNTMTIVIAMAEIILSIGIIQVRSDFKVVNSGFFVLFALFQIKNGEKEIILYILEITYSPAMSKWNT